MSISLLNNNVGLNQFCCKYFEYIGNWQVKTKQIALKNSVAMTLSNGAPVFNVFAFANANVNANANANLDLMK